MRSLLHRKSSSFLSRGHPGDSHNGRADSPQMTLADLPDTVHELVLRQLCEVSERGSRAAFRSVCRAFRNKHDEVLTSLRPRCVGLGNHGQRFQQVRCLLIGWPLAPLVILCEWSSVVQ